MTHVSTAYVILPYAYLPELSAVVKRMMTIAEEEEEAPPLWRIWAFLWRVGDRRWAAEAVSLIDECSSDVHRDVCRFAADAAIGLLPIPSPPTESDPSAEEYRSEVRLAEAVRTAALTTVAAWLDRRDDLERTADVIDDNALHGESDVSIDAIVQAITQRWPAPGVAKAVVLLQRPARAVLQSVASGDDAFTTAMQRENGVVVIDETTETVVCIPMSMIAPQALAALESST